MHNATRLWHLFDTWVLRILQAILALGIVAALAVLVLLLIRGVPHAVTEIGSVRELQEKVQSLFAGALLVVLGLELMDTLRNYFIEHRLRVELLLSVALIAVARHVIQLDYEHSEAPIVAGIALLLLVLAASYLGVRAFDRPPPVNRSERS